MGFHMFSGDIICHRHSNDKDIITIVSGRICQGCQHAFQQKSRTPIRSQDAALIMDVNLALVARWPTDLTMLSDGSSDHICHLGLWRQHRLWTSILVSNFFFFNFRDYNIISFPSSFPPSKFLHISTHHTVAHPSPCLTSSLSLCSERVEPSLVHHTLAHQLLKAMCILLH